MKRALILAILSLSSAAEAARIPQYKNLQYLTSEAQTVACKSIVPNPSPESIECMYFEHSVTSARNVGSGLAEGRRSSARLAVRPELPLLADRIARLVKANNINSARREWKRYVQQLSQIPYPIDLNEQIIWIVREAFIAADPEFDLRLKEFSSTAEALGLASDRVAEYKKLLGVCSQVPNCAVHEVQESLGIAQEAFEAANSSNEMAMIKLQGAISARGQLIQLISNMINAFNETTKSIIGNIR